MNAIKGLLGKGMGLHVVIGAFLVAFAVGVELVPELAASPEAARGALFAAASPARLIHPGPRPLAPRRLAEPVREEVKDPMSLDEFLGVMEKAAPAPVAAKVAKAFVKEPVLRKALEDFRRERGGGAPAAEFMERVGRLAEFRQMLSRFRGDPGFQHAFLTLAKTQDGDGVLRGAMASLKGAAGVGSGAGAKASARGRRFSGASSVRDGTRAVAMSGGAGASGAAQPAAFGAAAGASGLAGSPAGGGGGGRAGGGSFGSNAAGGGDTGGTSPKLAAVQSVQGPPREVNPQDPSVWSLLPPEVRAALDKVCTEKGICEDFFKQCYIAGVYGQCLEACNKTSQCRGSMPNDPTFAPVEVVDGDNGKYVVVDPKFVGLTPAEPGKPSLVSSQQPPLPNLTKEQSDQMWQAALTIAGGAIGIIAALALSAPVLPALLAGFAIGGAIGLFLDKSGLGKLIAPALAKAGDWALEKLGIAKEWLGNAVNTAVDAAKNAYHAVVDTVKKGYNTVVDTVKKGYRAVVDTAKNALDTVADGARSVWDAVTPW